MSLVINFMHMRSRLTLHMANVEGRAPLLPYMEVNVSRRNALYMYYLTIKTNTEVSGRDRTYLPTKLLARSLEKDAVCMLFTWKILRTIFS